MRPAHLSVVSAQTSDAKQPTVELRGVSKTFVSRGASVDVLSGVGFSLQSGEFLAVVGPSGSGKSTVLNLPARISSLRSGNSVKVDVGPRSASIFLSLSATTS